jgi:ATP-dependent RNA helicase RhlE
MNEQSFRALGVAPEIEQALRSRGIKQPFPIQELVLPGALAGHDVLAKSPTGSGKTLAFCDSDRREGGARSQPAHGGVTA